MARLNILKALIIAPLSMGLFSCAISCAKPQPGPTPPDPPPPPPPEVPYITAPDDLEQSINLVDGAGCAIYEGFRYSNLDIEDEGIFTINAPGFNEAFDKIDYQIGIDSLDTENQTFNVKVTINNGKLMDNVTSRFHFYYDDDEIEVDQTPIFHLSLTGEMGQPKIIYPEEYSGNVPLCSDTVAYDIPGFSYRGVSNPENIIIQPNFDASGVFKAKIINLDTDEQTFDVHVNGYDVTSRSSDNAMKFILDEQELLVPEHEPTRTTYYPGGYPDFKKGDSDSWMKLCINARLYGFKELQDLYHIETFIGLTKTFVDQNGFEYTVRVIGENHDDLIGETLYEGTKACLTFEMINVVCGIEKDEEDQPVRVTKFIPFDDTPTWNHAWPESTLRAFLNSDNYIDGFRGAYLPDWISLYIPRVKKKTLLLDGTVQETEDYVFVESPAEIGANLDPDAYSDPSVYRKEGTVYEFYGDLYSNESDGRRVKTSALDGSGQRYWLRSEICDPDEPPEGEKGKTGCYIEGGWVEMWYKHNPYQQKGDKQNFCVAPCFCI
ncbi:MAG: hypothetical protein KBS35_00440 [Mycoplasma sp.]|nr:hypothetical protein [Candidatus Hennigella equi]